MKICGFTVVILFHVFFPRSITLLAPFLPPPQDTHPSSKQAVNLPPRPGQYWSVAAGKAQHLPAWSQCNPVHAADDCHGHRWMTCWIQTVQRIVRMQPEMRRVDSASSASERTAAVVQSDEVPERQYVVTMSERMSPNKKCIGTLSHGQIQWINKGKLRDLDTGYRSMVLRWLPPYTHYDKNYEWFSWALWENRCRSSHSTFSAYCEHFSL